MEASYNACGEMIAEKWYDAADTLIAHYRYAYDGNQNVVRSVDILGLTEYNYMYEDGRLARASQSTIAVGGELVTGKTLVCSILYVYDSEGNLEKKRIVDADGTEDPQYSAVTAHNVAVCYLHLKKELGQTEQTEVSGLLAELGWDPHWVRQLERCRKKESVYYVGPQW